MIFPVHLWRAALSWSLTVVAAAALACGEPQGGGGADGPTEQPEFQQPVAAALDAGVEVYWMGETFRVGPLEYVISGVTRTIPDEGPVEGLKFEYGAEVRPGTVVLFLESYSADSASAETEREAALGMQGAESEDVSVGAWPGELVSMSLAPRPVNQQVLFVDVGEAVVEARAFSGDTGVPGQDVNPLIDSELLISVVAEHLRPYPE